MLTNSRHRRTIFSRWPGLVLSATSLAALLLIIQDQGPSLRAYYDTWLHSIPKTRVMADIEQKLIEPVSADPPQQEPIALLPSNANHNIRNPVTVRPTLPAPLPAEADLQIEGNSAPPLEQQPLIPDRIRIPAIQVDAVVVPIALEYQQINGQSQPVWPVPPPDQAGWHNSSASLGKPGNTVINGHNYPQDAIFRSLYLVQPGDKIMLYAKNRVFEYIVVKTMILPEKGQPLEVRQANSRYIQPFKDERLTLVTCHPYASLANRLLVIAVPVNELLDLIN